MIIDIKRAVQDLKASPAGTIPPSLNAISIHHLPQIYRRMHNTLLIERTPLSEKLAADGKLATIKELYDTALTHFTTVATHLNLPVHSVDTTIAQMDTTVANQIPSEGLVTALLSAKCPELALKVLNQHPHHVQKEAFSIASAAMSTCNLPALKQIIAVYSFSKEQYEHLLITSASSGFIEGFKRLPKYINRGYQPENLALIALQQGHLPFFIHLTKQPSFDTISDKGLTAILTFIAMKGYSKIFSTLNKKANIEKLSPESIQKIALYAATHPSILTLLLSHPHFDKMSDTLLGQIVTRAAQDNLVESLNLLKPYFSRLPKAPNDYCLKHSFCIAAQNGHCDVLRFLLPEISQDQPQEEQFSLNHSLATATQQGQLDVVKLLLPLVSHPKEPEHRFSLHSILNLATDEKVIEAISNHLKTQEHTLS